MALCDGKFLAYSIIRQDEELVIYMFKNSFDLK